MLTSGEQGNRFARNAAIMSKPNISYAARPTSGRGCNAKSQMGNLAFMAAIDIEHCSMDAFFPFNT